MKTLLSICFLEVIVSYKWDRAPRKVLEQTYFPYELCVLDSPELYNTSESVHSQSRCKDKMTPEFEKIPKRCWLGSRQQTFDFGTCFNKYWGCSPLSNRTGFLNHWSGLPHSTNKGHEHEIKFLSLLNHLKYESVVFIGDSMAVQLIQHLICKILRSDSSYIKGI